MMKITWNLKTFDALTPHELYAILQLRNEVFVVEQQCIFQDADDKDQHAHHLMGWSNGRLVAYTRLLPAGRVFNEVSIGRVVNAPGVRGTGLGKVLMQRSIETCRQLYGQTAIRIGAQCYLEKFYGSFGFAQAGEPYLEDGIQHIEMLLVHNSDG